MEQTNRITPTAITLAATATSLALSQGLYGLGFGDWIITSLLAWPGAFLMQSLGWASVYVPLLLGTWAWLDTRAEVSRAHFTGLLFSLLPFFTVAAMLKSLDPADGSWIVLTLNELLGATTPWFLALILVVEFLGGAALVVSALPKLSERSEPENEDYFPPKAARQEATLDPHTPFDTPYETQGSWSEEGLFPETSGAPEASEFPKGEFVSIDPDEPLQVPILKEWNSVRALKDDPYFELPEELATKSPALAALNRTLAQMPPEDELVLEPNKSLALAGTVVDWDNLVSRETYQHFTDEFDALDEADLDEEELEFDADFDEEREAEVVHAVQVLAQPSELIRLAEKIHPLEGGNFPSKVVFVKQEKTTVPFDQAPAAAAGRHPEAENDRQDSDQIDSQLADPTLREPTSAPAEATHWAQRPKFGRWHVPVEGLLTAYKLGNFSEIDDTTKRAGHILQMTLKEFNIEAQVTGIRKGPVVTMFEILPAAGVKLSKIVALADNIALGLAATSVRIVAPIPGKHAVGIEVPNKERTLVGFAEMVASREFQESTAAIPIVIGKDISGDTQIIDLTRTPHLLIAGATGAGKSVSVNTLVCSILYKKSPDEVKLLMVDPKIVELKFFNDIPHLLAPVITDPKKALQAIQWCLYEMERRYALLDAIGAKDIKSYNSKIEKRHIATNRLPYIVLVIDEFADLMATSGKDLEGTIARLAAMSRAVGIHLVLATQRPSVDVITGLIKANFPSRIAFQVASKTDSRIIIDQMGAEKLLGRGDMLFTSSWNPFPSRVQGAFLSEEDVERVVAHVKTLGEPEYISDEIFFDEDAEDEALSSLDSAEEMDPLFDKAVEIVRTFKKASASFLQRRLGVGYNRAARMVELMEEMGIVGPQQGSKPREIVHS